MEFDAGAATLAGIIAGVIMAVILYIGIAMMPRQMKMNLFLMLGTMMVKDTKMAYAAGAMMHIGMSVAFGLIHVALYEAFGLESALVAWSFSVFTVARKLSASFLAVRSESTRLDTEPNKALIGVEMAPGICSFVLKEPISRVRAAGMVAFGIGFGW